MDIPNINTILSRNETANSIKEFLTNFQENKNDLLIKRGIYIYGTPGTGKTSFVKNLLKEIGYDSLVYDAGDIRNKPVIETITKHNMTDTNIMSTFQSKKQHIAIIMDEIDGMNNGDKGGINTLIKLIRPKKTKKQKKEDTANSPIICISNHHADKKIKELMKVCEVFELKPINEDHITEIVNVCMPDLDMQCKTYISKNVQGDLRRLQLVCNIYRNAPQRLQINTLKTLLYPKSYNDDTKQITHNLFTNSYSINDHNTIMNETDRTIVGLLWHENVIDLLCKTDKKVAVKLYTRFLENICFADYIDRITFQKQIWQFNELSSLIKTFYNSKILHESINDEEIKVSNIPNDIRFTKVLTKYSTEFNNSTFIQNLCQQVGMDKKDMFLFFKVMDVENNESVYSILFESYDISKLDINRIMRYLDKDIVESKAKGKGGSCDDGEDTFVEDTYIEE
jgi:hypothetical protein